MTVPDWSARLYHGECVETMGTLEPGSIDAIVCDPPYELGFMGKAWDSSGVAFQTETWAAALRLLKPGGHLLAFGGTRTYHRMTVAIEDAGFDIRDSLHWIYGSGFPKSLDIAKAIDKAAGHWRGRAGEVTGQSGSLSGPHYERNEKGDPITATATATVWDGWGTGLKPSHEPITLARKPLDGSVAKNVLEHGVGGMNLSGCEVGTSGGTKQVLAKAGATGREATTYGASIGSAAGGNIPNGGRWATNTIIAHLSECAGNGSDNTDVLCVSGCPVAELNEASDEGGAARFFYISKPKKRERIGGTVRNLHPTVKTIDLMRYLVRLVTPPGGVVLDPFLGSGSTGCAAMLEGFRFVGIEMEQESFETATERISDYAFAAGQPKPERITPA